MLSRKHVKEWWVIESVYPKNFILAHKSGTEKNYQVYVDGS